MPVAAFRALGIGVLMLALGAGACAPAAPQSCQRYDALSLNPENDFAASLDWQSPLLVDRPPERIDVALSLLPPVRGPIELVHVSGDHETERWALTLPSSTSNANSVCWIEPRGGSPNCGVSLAEGPFAPGGYYYLRAGGNIVLEAGLAFYLCD